MTDWSHSFMGTRKVDPAGQILGTDYDRFESLLGIDGLAKETGDRLEILAVLARNAGTGQFRRFIAECKRHYKTVCIWEDWNPLVADALLRYGFRRSSTHTVEGELLIGWKWELQSQLELAKPD